MIQRLKIQVTRTFSSSDGLVKELYRNSVDIDTNLSVPYQQIVDMMHFLYGNDIFVILTIG